MERDEDVARQFASASAEALASSGDGSLFVEAFVERARHIEVQILADQHGTVWTLGTRDCSVQRRNQKIFEEAPAPGLSPETEAALCLCAEKLAKHCDYVGVGTVEFLLLPDERTFYFLEMNTRLQVEHTVTEAIYGFDLVGAQIDVAQGARLDEMQRPERRGSAIEARLNAEDPDDHFAPRTGNIVRFVPPQGPWIRVDAAYVEGNTISSAFDSNIAKIITWGVDREDALARQEAALHDTLCAMETGLTNRALLLEIVAAPMFRAGPVWTRWLDDEHRDPSEVVSTPTPGACTGGGSHRRSFKCSSTGFTAVFRGSPFRIATVVRQLPARARSNILLELNSSISRSQRYRR